ncbi:uncharacterized protein CDAR_293091 [Caerostris darwini]|uniref:Uncharacterized protein n=1 Tax=Caerostris darwini TaxID=1538125 RepID=A0AAV4TLX3_9ARAC|nr:uncharacterized protein CDAR_293091 [Caerostris darwini]
MEGKYLVLSEDEINYGTVNPCCDSNKTSSLDTKLPFEQQSPKSRSSKNQSVNDQLSFEKQSMDVCSCSPAQPCECGRRKKKVLLEPWARYKTISLAIGLSLFGVWMIVIAIVAKQGRL